MSCSRMRLPPLVYSGDPRRGVANCLIEMGLMESPRAFNGRRAGWPGPFGWGSSDAAARRSSGRDTRFRSAGSQRRRRRLRFVPCCRDVLDAAAGTARGERIGCWGGAADPPGGVRPYVLHALPDRRRLPRRKRRGRKARDEAAAVARRARSERARRAGTRRGSGGTAENRPRRPAPAPPSGSERIVSAPEAELPAVGTTARVGIDAGIAVGGAFVALLCLVRVGV